MTTANDRLDRELDELLEAIHRRYQHDFRNYARASLRRRVGQVLSALGLASVAELQALVIADAAAFTVLLRYLTVQVSEMFRDPPFYRALREHVMPVLRTYPSLRVWIAGCSHGEEVYSTAIVLHETGLLERTIIYATDINAEALRVAEAGVYPAARIPQFSRSYQAAGGRGSLSDYYTAAYASVVFDRRLRARVAFSDHSLATDSVFAEVHLISCRNVLIYFDRVLQDRALGLFDEALVRRGFLGLGARETIRFTAYAGSFDELSPGLFQRRAG